MQGRPDRNCVSAHVLLWEATLKHCRAQVHSGSNRTIQERRQRVFSYTIRGCTVTTVFDDQQLPIPMERNIGMR